MYNVKKYMVFDSKLKNEKPSEVFTYLVVNSGADPAEEMEGYFKECYDSGKKKFYIESGGMTTITNSVGSPLPAYKYNCYVK